MRRFDLKFFSEDRIQANTLSVQKIIHLYINIDGSYTIKVFTVSQCLEVWGGSDVMSQAVRVIRQFSQEFVQVVICTTQRTARLCSSVHLCSLTLQLHIIDFLMVLLEGSSTANNDDLDDREPSHNTSWCLWRFHQAEGSSQMDFI